MGKAAGGLDGALDRLADMGLGSLMRDVVEPVAAAMIAQAGEEMGTKQGAQAFVADYWSFARAVAQAFDEPKIAFAAAAMLFAAAPQHCSPWADVEKVDGSDRLAMPALKVLLAAAAGVADGNPSAFGSELVDAMVARQGRSAERAMQWARRAEAPKVPKAMEALSNEAEQGYQWPVDASMDAEIESAVGKGRNAGAADVKQALEVFEGQAQGRGNHALAFLFAAKLASALARSPCAAGVGAKGWEMLVDATLDYAEASREENAGSRQERKITKIKLSDLDRDMLTKSGRLIGAARERLAMELAAGIVERSGEPDADRTCLEMVGFMKEMFWGRGAAVGGPHQESFKTMAQAVCNRLCRDGGAACLPLQAAKELYGSMASGAPAAPEVWCSLTDPETLAWASGSTLAPSGAQWRQLAAFAKLDAVGDQRMGRWAALIQGGGWSLAPGEQSLADAISAKDLARGLGKSPLGVAIVSALDAAGVPDGCGLERLQDLLLWLSELGAKESACERAQAAMAQAMSVLERAGLEAALGSSMDPSAPSRRSRL